MLEVWKDIDGFDGIYQVSNMGRVRSFKNKKDRILKPRSKRSGYLYVSLYKSGKYIQRGVHGLALRAFTNKSQWKDVPNHKDLDKTNNKLSNLEWMTNSENIQHSVNAGNHKSKKLFTDEQVYMFREDYLNGISQEKIAEKYKIDMNTMGWVLRNDTYYNKNYSPPIRKYGTNSEDFVKLLKDMYYIYGVNLSKLSQLFKLKKSLVYSCIVVNYKYLND